jgi:hypothetical protein
VIYFCIPAYNEEQTVGVLLWKIRQVMTDFPRDYQILLADDASTDATPAVVAPYQRVLPLTVVRNPERRGYAASLETLLREAAQRAAYPKRDVVVTIQSDFTEDPADIVALIKRIEAGADIVSSNAPLPDSAPRGLRWSRRAALLLARRLRLPRGVRDPLSGMRAYRVFTIRRALDDCRGQRLLSVDGWAANAQLLALTAAYARRVDSIDAPLRWERLQRPSRTRGWESFKQVFHLLRGGAPAPGSAAELAETEIEENARVVARTREEREAARSAARAGRERGRTRRTREGAAPRERGRSSEPRSASEGRSPGRAGEESPARSRTGRTPPDGATSSGSRQRRRSPAGVEADAPQAVAADASADETTDASAAEATDAAATAGGGDAGTGIGADAPRKRRRSRRGGRGRRRRSDAAGAEGVEGVDEDAADPDDASGAAEAAESGEEGDAARRRRRSRRGGRRRRSRADRPTAAGEAADAGSGPDANASGSDGVSSPDTSPAEPPPPQGGDE